MRPARRDMDPDAASHAGRHDGFEVRWHPTGWFVHVDNVHEPVGAFHTSQAAHGAVKDAIDELIRSGKA